MTDREWHETYWRALTQVSPDAVLVVDTTGTILFSNRVPLVAGPRGIVGRKLWEFAVGDGVTRITGKLEEVVLTRKALRYENAGVDTTGAPAWYEVRVMPVVIDGAVDRVLWVSSDISERKRLEEQLGQAQKMEAIGLFAGGVAHDFNNILAVILAASDYALRRQEISPSLKALLGEVADAARRGGDLTRRLLTYARTDTAERRPLDLGAAVADLARMIRRVIGDDVGLVLDEPAAPIMVQADAVQLEQVLMNLCTNAHQAMPTGGQLHLSTADAEVPAELVAKTRPGSPHGRSFAVITVRDTGLGMDAVTRARLFEPFFTTKAEGTGLGLPTVKRIVHQHGGFVTVDSEPGEGTTFKVFLPRVNALDEAANADDLTALAGHETILLAEDEPVLRALVTTTLADLGYRVIAVPDGEQAVAALNLHADQLSLAVLDVLLPHLDGREVYTRVRALRPDLKVIFTTGYAPARTRLSELLGLPGVTLLEKPFTTYALAASVRAAIDGR